MTRRQTYIYIVIAVVIIGSGVGLFGGIYFRWYTAPYNATAKTIAWTIDMPEPAYNFDTVVAGRLYRSGFPDARFLDYVRRRYGIQHVVSLFGASEVHARAKELGMKVTILDWRHRREIPAQDLKMVLDLFEGNERVFLHCHAGRDRTGFAIATYRILRQRWPLQRAVEEMEAHGHSRRARLKTTRQLRELLEELNQQQNQPHYSDIVALRKTTTGDGGSVE
jgi:protein-tyrosine phosphatase